MLEEKEKEPQGAPWKDVEFREKFEEADAIRIRKLKEDPDIEVKVKWMPSKEKFVVKVRRDPLVVASEKLFNRSKSSAKRNRGKKKSD